MHNHCFIKHRKISFELRYCTADEYTIKKESKRSNESFDHHHHYWNVLIDFLKYNLNIKHEASVYTFYYKPYDTNKHL